MSQTHSVEDKPVDLYEQCVKSFKGFPDKTQLETWKHQVPGGRVRVFPLPDGKRVSVLRGLTALELQGIQAEASKLSTPEKQANEVAILIALRGTLWSNFTPEGKPSAEYFRNAGAGLAQTIHLAVLGTSDFVDPVAIEEMVFDI